LQRKKPNDFTNSEISDSLKSKEELLEEIQFLRRRLAAMEADNRSKRERNQILSGVVKIGYWEWDETTNRAAYFSKEMAEILGVSLESLYVRYRSTEDFYPLCSSRRSGALCQQPK
jgi:hypothetical protein